MRLAVCKTVKLIWVINILPLLFERIGTRMKICASGLLIFNLMLSGCATESQSQRYPELRSVFESYRLHVDSPEAQQSGFFTESMWKAWQGSRKFSNPDTPAPIEAFNRFPDDMRVKSSVETIEHNKGCLIVQGYNGNGMPMDYIITFVKPDRRWLIADFSAAIYKSDEERWLAVPVCEPEQRHSLWHKTG